MIARTFSFSESLWSAGVLAESEVVGYFVVRLKCVGRK